MRESFAQVDPEDMKEPRLIAHEFNKATESRARHKKEFREEANNIREDLKGIRNSIDKLTEKMDSFREDLHRIELSQFKENGKLWAKIAGLGAAMGGMGYFVSSWIKGIK